jgi:hypothetical protein
MQRCEFSSGRKGTVKYIAVVQPGTAGKDKKDKIIISIGEISNKISFLSNVSFLC